jgi:hypothetical protein
MKVRILPRRQMTIEEYQKKIATLEAELAIFGTENDELREANEIHLTTIVDLYDRLAKKSGQIAELMSACEKMAYEIRECRSKRERDHSLTREQISLTRELSPLERKAIDKKYVENNIA